MLRDRMIWLGLAMTLGISGCSLFGVVSPTEIRPSMNLYATLPAANAISVVSLEDHRFTNSIPVGQSPQNIAVNSRADLEFAYCTNDGDNTVSFVNLRTGATVQTVSVGSKPWGIALGARFTTKDSGGNSVGVQRLYTANSGDNTYSVIDISDSGTGFSYTKQMPADFLGRPHGVVVDATGQVAYILSDQTVTNPAGKTGCYICKIDANKSATAATMIEGAKSLWKGAIADTFMYVTDRGNTNLWKIDLANNLSWSANLNIGAQTDSIVIDAKKQAAYVSIPAGSGDQENGTVVTVNLTTSQSLGGVRVNAVVAEARQPRSLALSSTGSELWVALQGRLGYFGGVNTTNVAAPGINLAVVPYTSSPGEAPPIGDLALGAGVQ